MNQPHEDPSSTASAKAVLFDYGGVITTPIRGSIASWTSEADIDPQSFSRVLKRWLGRDASPDSPIHRLERGELSASEFNTLLTRELRSPSGDPVPPGDYLRGMFKASKVDEGTVALVRDLRAAGVRTGLLSNSWGFSYDRTLLDELFDPVVISGEVGMRKPEKRIFDLAVERLGLAPGDVVFVDDAEPNLVGARAAGLRTVLHKDAATTRAAFEKLLQHAPTSASL
ncbi:HAD-IA family hydrolase [Allobranchiibius huperziae]|uniref:Putative hydrolase of the HAD superfamily n=1 Tax=Allobranchiibius huperziae TaxID=1874116 RepID=A0A853DIJ4_9MICO|nr:putative hydrolase of the HAD superfamily [Allobranchiibius huperziae]